MCKPCHANASKSHASFGLTTHIFNNFSMFDVYFGTDIGNLEENNIQIINYNQSTEWWLEKSSSYLRIKIRFFSIHHVMKLVGRAKIPWSAKHFL